MIRTFVILVTLLLSAALAAAEQTIVAVKSIPVKPYEDALKGFRAGCSCRIIEFVASEMVAEEIVSQIRQRRPDLILAIGMDALMKTKRIRDIPIVYLMVANPQSVVGGEDNIAGVSMDIAPEKQFQSLQKILPEAKRVGILFNPGKTAALVKKAQSAAAETGIKLLTKEIQSPKEVPSALLTLKGKIDVFWMIPDSLVVTTETTESLLLFSVENRVPILTFSEKYVEMGALLSVGIDPHDIGRQVSDIAKKILAGTSAKNIRNVDPRKAILSVNQKVAKKLGIVIDETSNSNMRIIK